MPVAFKVSVRAVEVPQLLEAETEIVPPALLAVALMLFVLLLPVHPPGNIQA